MSLYEGGKLMLQGRKSPDEDEEFNRLMRAVASGKMTVDEAWGNSQAAKG